MSPRFPFYNDKDTEHRAPMSAYPSHAYSSPMSAAGGNERTRNALASPQSNPHVLNSSGHGNMNIPSYAYSTNVAPTAPSAFGVGNTLNESMASSRPQYQPGYLLSLAQNQNPQPVTRSEETHVIPVRAKMNPAFARSTTSDFGTESMFETAKHHRHDNLDEEDGPPSSSVNDIVNDTHTESYRLRPQNIYSTPNKLDTSRNTSTPSAAQHQPLYVIVFGYPSSRYSATAVHFQSLAENGTTDPEVSTDVENAFKIGYRQPWEAARAWKKNGEIISGEGGRWIVGVKWADPQLAEQILGSGARPFSSFSPIQTPDAQHISAEMDVSPDPTFQQLQRYNASQHDSASSIGTPLRLAPSAAAFRKAGPNDGLKSAPNKLQNAATTGANGSPAKGVLGQVSDLIFGW